VRFIYLSHTSAEYHASVTIMPIKLLKRIETSVKKCLEMKIKFAQLCVWPGTIVGNSPEKIEEFTKDMAVMFKGARFLYVTEVFTKPDVVDGIHVRGTGGRNDLFFYIHDDDMSKFAVQRLQYGIRWWEDIIGNGELYLYPDDFIKRFPKRW
jgi:hypothetical protein